MMRLESFMLALIAPARVDIVRSVYDRLVEKFAEALMKEVVEGVLGKLPSKESG